MEVMTREYCERCPWFDANLGYLEADHSYWESNNSSCVCKDCFMRSECEITGPKDSLTCVLLTEERIKKLINILPSESKKGRMLKKLLEALGR